MSNITLKIETSVIGTEPTKTVDARQLHKNLGVRKDFSNWIKGQINNLGLEEGVDFKTIALKGVGGKFDSIDYTLTLDTAKHISMASRTPRGKEVRNYFIEAEKKLTQIGEAYRAQNTSVDMSSILSIMETQSRIMETMQVQNTLMLTMVQSISESIERNHANSHLGMCILIGGMKTLLKERNTVFGNSDYTLPKDERISSDQRNVLYSTVNARASYLSASFCIKTDVIASAIFAALKTRFSRSHYSDISDFQFDEAVEFVNDFEISNVR
jgi:phage anti-repressor protein